MASPWPLAPLSETGEQLVKTFVTSRLDYRNSLFSGCPINILKTLQFIQNAVAGLLTRTNIRHCISTKWLPVKFRIEFKIFVLTYKAIHGQSSSYLKELVIAITKSEHITMASGPIDYTCFWIITLCISLDL